MKKKKISVIIPNYNSEKTLDLCLRSIYYQDYPNYEVIVVDDVSNDGSLEIARKYPCQILKMKRNGGPAATRNVGAKGAKGKILFFVDSDIALRHDALSVAEQKFKQIPNLGAVCGIYSKIPLIRDSLVEEYRVLQDYYWKKSTKGFITTLSVANGAIRKDVFFEIGGFNSRLRASEDVEFGNRISRRYRILSTPEIIGKHDGDDRLIKILKNFYRRSKERVGLFLKVKKFNKGYATSNRGLGVILAGVSLIPLLLGLVDIYFLLFSLLFFISFLISDLGLYLFVLKEKGIFFIIYFILIHYLVNLAIFAGVFTGTIELTLKGVNNV